MRVSRRFFGRIVFVWNGHNPGLGVWIANKTLVFHVGPLATLVYLRGME